MNCFRLRFVVTLALGSVIGGCSSNVNGMLTGQPSIETARVALASGSGQLALNICDSLLRKMSKDPDLLVCRGDALSSMGRNAEAIPAYEAALHVEAGSAGAKIGLGRVFLATDPPRAEALFLAALTNDPRNPVALNNLGIARDLQGRHDAAQAAYGEAIAAAPEMRAPQVNLALSLAMSGKGQQALTIMRPIASQPSASEKERHDLAAVLAMDGKSDEAAQVLRNDLSGTQADEAVTRYRDLQAR